MGIYIDALKIYNSNSKDGTKWITPRKNTTDYNAVIKIMEDLKKNAKPKEPKTKKEQKANAKPKTKAAPKTKKEPIKTDTTVRG